MIYQNNDLITDLTKIVTLQVKDSSEKRGTTYKEGSRQLRHLI